MNSKQMQIADVGAWVTPPLRHNFRASQAAHEDNDIKILKFLSQVNFMNCLHLLSCNSFLL